MPTPTIEQKSKVGRPRTCECGRCPTCKQREKKRRHRERRNDRLEKEYGLDRFKET